MRVTPARWSVALLLLAGAAAARPDDTEAAVRRQKAAIAENLKKLQAGATATTETPDLILVGTLPEARLRTLGATLQRQYAAAYKALQYDSDKPWSGKLTVYVFADRSQFRSFVRQVEQRSPDEGEAGSHDVKSATPFVAVGPGKGKEATPEAQAGLELAATLLAGRAKSVQLPDWLVEGFSRATVTQGTPAAASRKSQVVKLGRAARDAWNEALPTDQRPVLWAAVADYLFYGKGVANVGDFLLGFRPDEEKPMKTGEDALAAAKLTPEKFEIGFAKWLRTR
jgi:hypothetical protein